MPHLNGPAYLRSVGTSSHNFLDNTNRARHIFDATPTLGLDVAMPFVPDDRAL